VWFQLPSFKQLYNLHIIQKHLRSTWAEPRSSLPRNLYKVWSLHKTYLTRDPGFSVENSGVAFSYWTWLCFSPFSKRRSLLEWSFTWLLQRVLAQRTETPGRFVIGGRDNCAFWTASLLGAMQDQNPFRVSTEQNYKSMVNALRAPESRFVLLALR
jgi:hypothetical protein